LPFYHGWNKNENESIIKTMIQYHKTAFRHGVSMTDEEAMALDEEFTNGTLRLGEGMGPTMRRRELLRLLDEVSANYIITIAESTQKTPAQVVGEMVRREIAVKSGAARL
jgi:hypothetical protein